MASGRSNLMLRATRARQWHNWRTDYRCSRPPVTCRGCGRHYEPHQNTAVMTFVGFNLVHCSNCDAPKAEKPKTPIIFPKPKKCIGRDVACRYIVRFHGSTFWYQTDIDTAEVYLRNAFGDVIAKVGTFDSFPKPVDEIVFDDMPF